MAEFASGERDEAMRFFREGASGTRFLHVHFRLIDAENVALGRRYCAGDAAGDAGDVGDATGGGRRP